MKFLLCFLLLIKLASTIEAQDNFEQILVRKLQSNPHLFQQVKFAEQDHPSDFSVELGKSVITLDNGEVFDGFRFKAPENAESLDFIWYFNAPHNWANWYLCPVKGENKPSFKGWYNADKLYKKFDSKRKTKNFRSLQTLQLGYFTAGEEYIMWFRRTGEEQQGVSNVKGRFMFTQHKERWSYKDTEVKLNLKPWPIGVQIDALNSKGGKILLDTEFFQRDYAKGRIEHVFFTKRQTQQLNNGFFITMQISIPSCTTSPSLNDIEKRYGKPDFVQSNVEKNLLAKHSDNEPDHDPDIVTYYYDYFGFEINKNDPHKKVLRVTSQAINMSEIAPKGNQASFNQISMKNLTLFHNNGKQVGRMFFFLEGNKDPLSIQTPPVGTYHRGKQTLEHLGKNKWIWKTSHEDGSTARIIHLEENLMHGKAQGFHPNGKPSFQAFYKKGLLNGKLIEFTNKGGIIRERTFKDGRPLPKAP